MDDVIKSLTPEQALEIIKRLSGKGGALGEAVLSEAKNLLSETDPDQTAEDVFFALDTIDVQDCWNRSGRSRHGYTSPDEAAVEIIEEELKPFLDQIERYHELGMPEQETAYCMGVVLGIYRYEQESTSEFKGWAGDTPGEYAGFVMSKWRERHQGTPRQEAACSFLRERCPEWADSLAEDNGEGLP
jgi:hypothetical protein